MAYFLGKTAEGGKRLGFAAMLGASTGLLVHSALAALGLSALLAASAEAFTALKYAGAAYLLWLSFQALRTGSKFTLTSDRGSEKSLFRTYIGGLVINLMNPKIILFFVTFLPQFVDRGDVHAAAKLLFLGLFFIVIGGVIGGLIILAAHPFIRFLAGSRRGKRVFDYVFAGLMGTFAARLLLMEGR
jgi:threonine/homoserine/homoserine lactone efflux protein